LFAHLKKQSITCIFATHDANDVLSFADEIAVLRNGKVFAAGPTELLYNNPQSRYVAALFDEVNEIPSSFFGESSNGSRLFYPHQLKLTEKGIGAVVSRSYFRGSRFL